ASPLSSLTLSTSVAVQRPEVSYRQRWRRVSGYSPGAHPSASAHRKGFVAFLWSLIGFGLSWLAFAYLGYPALLWLLARLAPRPVAAADVHPPLSVIIANPKRAAPLPRP